MAQISKCYECAVLFLFLSLFSLLVSYIKPTFLIFALLCCIACYIVIFDDDVTDALALLVEFGSSSSEHNQKSAVLVLRNLCFNTAGKSKLLATGKSCTVRNK